VAGIGQLTNEAGCTAEEDGIEVDNQYSGSGNASAWFLSCTREWVTRGNSQDPWPAMRSMKEVSSLSMVNGGRVKQQ
jgi:hypothetical protein